MRILLFFVENHVNEKRCFFDTLITAYFARNHPTIVVENIRELLGKDQCLIEEDLLVLLDLEEVWYFEIENIIGGEHKNILIKFDLVAIRINAWHNGKESYLLILEKFDFVTHDCKEVVYESDILAIDSDLATHINPPFRSSPHKFRI